MEAANLPTFVQFVNAKKSYICVIFAKNYGGHETGGLEQNWGAVPLRPRSKTAKTRNAAQ